MQTSVTKKLLLVILDGFGLRDSQDFNTISAAKTPNIHNYINKYAFGRINASEMFVGLPSGQFGNSEVGHLSLGAGRIIRQDITRIDHAIETGEFFTNQTLVNACNSVVSGNIHIMGLLSDGGVHAHISHILALIKLASDFKNIHTIWVHAFLDGRDTPPQSAKKYIEELESYLKAYPKAKLASLSGRYYAMDRDKRYERIQRAYNAISYAIGDKFNNPLTILEQSYSNNIFDEFINPSVASLYSGIISGDAIIFANYRSDRAGLLTEAFVDKNFKHFKTGGFELSSFVTMTRYSDSFEVPIAFAPQMIKNTLGEYLAHLGLKQLRIAETEKYPHITYFFNGGERQPFNNEERILINSPKEVATYDEKPEMSLPEVADAIVKAIKTNKYDLIITNFANGDMVGHTGNYSASIQAVEALDKYLGQCVDKMLSTGGEVLVVADHGNCEEMFDYTCNQPHTQHTTNLVPCIYIGRPAKVRTGGSLQDVAPTLLALMGLAKPQEMTGLNLVELIK